LIFLKNCHAFPQWLWHFTCQPMVLKNFMYMLTNMLCSACFIFFFCFWNRILLCSPGWPWTCDHPAITSPKYWDYMCVPSCLAACFCFIYVTPLLKGVRGYHRWFWFAFPR
jgi:hypothetical protein